MGYDVLQFKGISASQKVIVCGNGGHHLVLFTKLNCLPQYTSQTQYTAQWEEAFKSTASLNIWKTAVM